MPDPTPSKDEYSTIIGADAQFKGDLSFQGGVRIDGQFEGTIQTTGRVLVSKGGKLKAEVKAGGIAVEGAVEGNLHAEDRIELRATAHLRGDVKAAKLLVVEGATFVGPLRGRDRLARDGYGSASGRRRPDRRPPRGSAARPVAHGPLGGGGPRLAPPRRPPPPPLGGSRHATRRSPRAAPSARSATGSSTSPIEAKSVNCRHCNARVVTEALDVGEYVAVRVFATANRMRITKKGKVFAAVRADELTIEGFLHGRRDGADRRSASSKSAHVTGAIRALTLAVEPGATLVGDVRVGPDSLADIFAAARASEGRA